MFFAEIFFNNSKYAVFAYGGIERRRFVQKKKSRANPWWTPDFFMDCWIVSFRRTSSVNLSHWLSRKGR